MLGVEGGSARHCHRLRLHCTAQCRATHNALLAHASTPSQLMGKNKVLVKVNPEGKYVVDLGE